MEAKLPLRFAFVRHCDVFSITLYYVIYLFDVVTFFNDVRLTFYFGTFEAHMEITL